MIKTFTKWCATYCNLKMLTIFLLGFSSGLPLALVSGTLQAWFKTSGASIITIGFMSLITQPYSYKFLWSPFLDKYAPSKFLDHRRSWILITQLSLIILIIAMALFDTHATVTIFQWQVPVLFILGFLLSFMSASQDIAIDAYRTEILHADERGLGAALGTEGYRLAMLVSGALALILAANIGWQKTYLLMSGIMLIGVLATFIAPKINHKNTFKDHALTEVVIASFKDFWQRKQALLILILVILYKLSDAFAASLSTSFLIDLHFSLAEIGTINKILGAIATLLGLLVGGIFMTRMGLFKSLLTFAILSAFSNLSFMLLATVGKNYLLACCATFIENICAGMGTAAFVALIMSLCNKQYIATQFALLTSLAAMGRIYTGPVSGYLVENIGWAKFYCFTAIVAIPAILLLTYLRKQINQINK